MNVQRNQEKISLEKTVLMIVDIQEKLFPFMENKEEILKNNSILLKGAKILNLKTIVTEQYPKGLGHTIKELQEDLTDLELWEKDSFSVCMDNKSQVDKLIAEGKDTFILTGIESHICVYQTAKDLLFQGQKVCVIYDACGSRKKENHKEIMNTLRELGAFILPTESILFELMISSTHPSFKKISNLIK